MYRAGKVAAIVELTLSPAAVAELQAEPGEYVEGSFAIYASDGLPGGKAIQVGETLDQVGIRLKGHEGGSFRGLDMKPGFKIKFNKFVKHQYFDGLKKMTLNNMVQDPSMLHEALAYAGFRALGVPASRTGYAEVLVNGEDYGMYLNIEDMDDIGLERWFGEFEEPPQHLYEGEYGADAEPGKVGEFEVDEGEEGDLHDLEALIEAVNSEAGPDWYSQVSPVADLGEMTRMWALEKYIGHWDGYSGEAGFERPNNYYLYSSPAGVFQMLPWGTDQTWVRHLPFDGTAGLMFDKCLLDAACLDRYREAVAEAGSVLPGLELDSLAGCLAEELAPWQALESEGRREYDSTEIAQGVEETRGFIAERPSELSEWLETDPSPTEPTGEGRPIACGPESEDEDEGKTVGGEHGAEVASEPSSSPIGTPAPQAGDRPAVQFEGTGVVGASVRTRLRLRLAGRVRQIVRLRLQHGRPRVCASHSRLAAAGELNLHCRLSGLARRHLRRRWLKLQVEVYFEPDGEQERSIRRTVLARRLGA